MSSLFAKVPVKESLVYNCLNLIKLSQKSCFLQWFEEKQQQIENLDQQLRKLHNAMETLVIHRRGMYLYLSYDVASESEITPCNKIDNPLVVYRLYENVMTSITRLRT